MMFRKTFIFFVSLFLISQSGLLRPAYAQEEQPIWPDQGYAESIEGADAGDVNAAAHVTNVNTNNYSDLIRRIVGPVPGVTVTSMDSPLAKRMLAQSAIYNVNKYIAYMYVNPPASTYAFVRDMGQSLGFIPKTAYAQGVGFGGLSALLPVWKVFRNMAYFLLAIVIVVVGFLVMFRKKIDPKTVVTVQNALPRIVIALLLITFSYAIVGICIDIMYLLIALVGSIFKNAGLLPEATMDDIVNGRLWGSAFSTTKQWGMELFGRIIFGTKDPAITAGLMAVALFGSIVGLLGAPYVGIPILIAGGTPLLLGVLISIGVFFLVVRLFIFFLGAYIRIITSLLFSPFQLLMSAFPGSQALDSWFKNLIANILVFPAGAVMFLIANVFMNLSDSSTPLWHPPYTSLFVYNTTSTGTLVSLGILFAIPSVGKMIQDALKAKPSAIGGVEGIGGIFGAPIQTAMQAYQFYTSHETMKYFKNQGRGTQQH
jgi:hypothetical protein